MIGKKHAFTAAKKRYVPAMDVSYSKPVLRNICLPHLMFVIMTGVAITMVKFLCLGQSWIPKKER